MYAHVHYMWDYYWSYVCTCVSISVDVSLKLLPCQTGSWKKNSLWRHFEEIDVQYTECVDILQHCYELHIANIFRCIHRQQFHQAQHVCIIETVSGINICQCCKGIYLIFYVILKKSSMRQVVKLVSRWKFPATRIMYMYMVYMYVWHRSLAIVMLRTYMYVHSSCMLHRYVHNVGIWLCPIYHGLWQGCHCHSESTRWELQLSCITGHVVFPAAGWQWIQSPSTPHRPTCTERI